MCIKCVHERFKEEVEDFSEAVAEHGYDIEADVTLSLHEIRLIAAATGVVNDLREAAERGPEALKRWAEQTHAHLSDIGALKKKMHGHGATTH